MDGQYLCNRAITVSYAYKKDTKGERHGTPAGTTPCPPLLGCNFVIWKHEIFSVTFAAASFLAWLVEHLCKHASLERHGRD
jgi:hypothetical protein